MYKTFNSIRLIFLLFSLSWKAFSKEIEGAISFSNLKFTPLTALHYPHQGWSASFDFKIEKSSIDEGDYFTLNFPTVYRIKFSNNELTTNATLEDGSPGFECFAAQQAAYRNKDTILKCIAMQDLSSYPSLSGSLSFGLSFSSGGSAYQYEMQNADTFHSGSTQISLADQLSGQIDFNSANASNDIYTIGRSTTFNELESYYLGMSCPNGYLLGGTETINYDRENKGYDLNCSSVQVHLADRFNDWSLPLTADKADANIDCSGDVLKITMNQANQNQKLWVNALQHVSDGVNTVQHEVHLQYSCSNTEQKTTYKTQFSTVVDYTIYQASDSGTLSGLFPTSSSSSQISTPTITSTTSTQWTGTYTTTYSTGSTELSGSTGVPTEEIIYYVETPIPTSTPESITTTTTTTTGWTGTYTTTYSTGSTELSESTGVPTEEIIYYVETPVPTSSLESITTTTTTTGWTGTYNSTYSTGSTELSGSTGVPTEEIIYYMETPITTSTPESITTTTTTTTGWTGTYTTTYSTGSTELSESTGVPTEEIIYYVETPVPTSSLESITTTTTTTGWTGTYNSTYSTGSTELSGSTGVPTEEIIYYMETPIPTSTPESITMTTTTTTGWTGTYTTTYSTGSTELSGSTGVPTEEIIYYVETPIPTSSPESITTTTTTTTGWTGTYNSTYSTGSTELSGSTGVPTEEIIYYVETPVPTSTPESITTTTITTGWTGAYNSTYSTGSTELSGSTGVPTEEIIYYVETPIPTSTPESITTTTTTTTGWTGTYNSTYSTGSTELSGSTGVPTEEIIYYMETPIPTSTPESITTTTTTTGWTGTYNSTYSTGSTELSGSTGVPTEEIIYYVETPSQSKSTSAYSTFNSITTSSTTVLNSSRTITTCNYCTASTSVTFNWSTSGTSASSDTPSTINSTFSTKPTTIYVSETSSVTPMNYSSAAAMSTTAPPVTTNVSSGTGHFSLGFSLEQPSMTPAPSCSFSISTATATVTVTHTTTERVSEHCHCSFNSTSTSSSSSSSGTRPSPSLALYSDQALTLKGPSTVPALIGILLFLL